jgi:periplasmic divalent cation tolerance protein
MATEDLTTDHVLILCTAPSPDVGATLARGLVEARLAACVNLVPGIRSFYRWEGAVHDETEVQLLIKTRSGRFAAVAAWIKGNHPYSVPEVIAIPIPIGADSYLNWLTAETGDAAP